MKFKVSLFDVIAVFVIILICIILYNYLEMKEESQRRADYIEEKGIQEIHIPRRTDFDFGETVEIELPRIALSDSKDSTHEELMEEFRHNLGQQGVYFEDMYIDSEGTIKMSLTKTQLDAYIHWVEVRLQEGVDSAIPVRISEDFSCVYYQIPPDCDFFDFGITSIKLTGYLAMTQTILGTPANQWMVTEVLYYKDSDVVLFELQVGANKGYEIAGKEWLERLEEAEKQVDGVN